LYNPLAAIIPISTTKISKRKDVFSVQGDAIGVPKNTANFQAEVRAMISSKMSVSIRRNFMPKPRFILVVLAERKSGFKLTIDKDFEAMIISRCDIVTISIGKKIRVADLSFNQ
jgi:hypothetical protein